MSILQFIINNVKNQFYVLENHNDYMYVKSEYLNWLALNYIL